jgi:hypothetical protein
VMVHIIPNVYMNVTALPCKCSDLDTDAALGDYVRVYIRVPLDDVDGQDPENARSAWRCLSCRTTRMLRDVDVITLFGAWNDETARALSRGTREHSCGRSHGNDPSPIQLQLNERSGHKP